MIELAHHINPLTSIPGSFLFHAALTAVFIPTSFVALILGVLFPNRYGIAAGTIVALVPTAFAVYGWTCWGCSDHEIFRQVLDPISAYLGAGVTGFAIASLPRFLERRKARQNAG